jgi:hypothetical protein
MGLHRCTEVECPYLGQATSRSCGCHKTDEQILQERVAVLLKVAKQQAAEYFREHPAEGYMREGYRCLECRNEISGPRSAGLVHDKDCELANAIAKATQ